MTDNKQPLKSVNNKKCLTKCYAKNHTFIHPIFLHEVENKNTSSCAIGPFSMRPNKDGIDNALVLSDECRMKDNKDYRIPDKLESLLLGFYFDPLEFLNNVYDIYSFDDVVKWTIDNKDYPYYTKKRIHNCAWTVFGDSISNISNIVLDFYYNIAKTSWLMMYTKLILKIYSINAFIDDKNATSEDLYKIFLKTSFTYNFFVSCIKSYIEENKDDWNNIHDHFDNIKEYIYPKFVQLYIPTD